MKQLRIGLVGTGWRSHFFIRIAQMLPERFQIVGAVYRSEHGRETALRWGVPGFANHQALVDLAPDYVILSVDRDSMGGLMRFYARHGVPLLIETFPAKDVDELLGLYHDLTGAKIQAAEQYPWQPLNAARLALANSGILGRVYQMQTSLPNGYHAVSVQRKLLHAGQRCPVIRANRYTHAMADGPNRSGDPTEDKLVDAKQTLYQLDYGDRQAINDLEDNQHRSFIRTQHWVIRGERCELRGEDVLYLKELLTPCRFTLERVMAGEGQNLEGLYLRGVRGGSHGWYYQNPYIPARLFDDEIAVAACMDRMGTYLETGEAFYPLEEELMDLYLALMIQKAADEDRPLEVQPQPWTE
ncbi:MAG: gfo/Idh/MocA family oxidoreductase [Firmicutes bacterium]|nr:gfo/Idh/MocA family oxidoreductase [Bacillota bacterium]